VPGDAAAVEVVDDEPVDAAGGVGRRLGGDTAVRIGARVGLQVVGEDGLAAEGGRPAQARLHPLAPAEGVAQVALHVGHLVVLAPDRTRQQRHHLIVSNGSSPLG